MWREGFVPGGRTRFFVRALGHGDDLVLLLHGWPEDGSMWRRVAPLLAVEGWRVAAPDLKGYGRSDKPRDGYDPETLADEISQLIRNLHVRRAVVVGHDWGGAVALATAFRHPGLVRSVVLASAPYRQLDLRRSWHIPAMNVPVLPELGFRYGARPLVAAALRHGAVVTEAFPESLIDHYADVVSQDPGAWLRYYRSLSRRAVVDWAMRKTRRSVSVLPNPRGPNHLRVPALVLWGEDDPATPYHLAPGVAHDLGAELVSFPGVGHFVPEEHPRGVAHAILDFIGTATPTSALAREA